MEQAVDRDIDFDYDELFKLIRLDNRVQRLDRVEKVVDFLHEKLTKGKKENMEEYLMAAYLALKRIVETHKINKINGWEGDFILS